MSAVHVAESAGFCFGVKRAVEISEQSLTNDPKPYMLRKVIHNRAVMDNFIEKGLVVVSDLSEVPDGQSVIISAHGLAKAGYEEMERRNIHCIDTTCPFVRKIHKIVKRQHEADYSILVVGDACHPEVLGIVGWCDNRAHVISDVTALEALFEERPDLRAGPLCLVGQTTLNPTVFEACANFINLECTNRQIFDTICSTTKIRQKEAAALALQCEAMVVIGSQDSSNTQKLYKLCKERSDAVFFVERAAELPPRLCARFASIGVTAGASTPAFIIKEVVNTMTEERTIIMDQEEKTPEQSMEMNFAEQLEQSFKTLNSGDIVTGIVAGIAPNEIHVDLGTKHDGYIPMGEYSYDPEAKPEEQLKVGGEIEVFVVRVNDVEGTIMLSKKKVDSIRGWLELEKSFEEGAIVDGTIIEAIKGGVITLVNGLRVFVPASLAAERYTSDLSTLVGNKVRLRLIELNRQRRRVTGSIKVVLDEERKEKSVKVWSEIETGKSYQGIVKSLTSYGVFVDIGGVDGMVHISELSWGRVRHPGEVVNVGDAIEVYVLSANAETKKISLGCKKSEDNPWAKFEGMHNVNDILDVKVVKLMPFGAFAEILPGVDGLIHISQIADQRIAKPGDVLSVGDEVKVRITNIDKDNQKVNLTIRGLSDVSPEGGEQAAPAPQPEETFAVDVGVVSPGLTEEEAHADLTTLDIELPEPCEGDSSEG